MLQRYIYCGLSEIILHKVDLYSFGVVLYNLAFGCYPYGLTYGDEEDYGTILEKIKNNELNLENKMGYSAHFLNFFAFHPLRRYPSTLYEV